MTKTTYAPFDAADYLDNDAVIAEYLSAAIDDPNPDVFSPRSATLPRRTAWPGSPRTPASAERAFYKALSSGAHPRYETMSAILRAFGVKFAVVADQPQSR
jgi:probable addiction module antidote protein